MATQSSDFRELWCDTARHASDGQLVACVAAAVVAVIAFVIALLIDVRRALSWWPIVLPTLFIGAFGLWAIADRSIDGAGASRFSRDALIALRWAAAVAAAVVGLLATIGVLRLTIGTWIS